MLGDETRNSLLEAVVFRPVYMRKWLGYPKAVSASEDVSNNNFASVDMTAAEQITSSSSYIFERLKEFCSDENVNFEKWITLKSMKMAFFSQTVLSVVTKMILSRANQQNMSFPDNNISDGLRRCLTKSIFSGAVMAVNIGCIMISITQFAVWREHFSLWTVPCATTFIPTIFSYSLGVKPLQVVKGGLMLGMLSSLALFGASLFYELSIDETYQCLKNDIEIRLREERESELYRFMKEHHIRSKWFGKWMLNRSRIDEDIDDELS
uniref:Transmembrane protein n=1 Tax=Elaeophora elaphi TaxID=1147741 RepID=A0A0R3RFM5_9BILA